MGWPVFGGVLTLLLLAGVAVGAVLLRRSSTPRRAIGETPVEILQRRYASGQIDEDDYLRRLSGIENA